MPPLFTLTDPLLANGSLELPLRIFANQRYTVGAEVDVSKNPLYKYYWPKYHPFWRVVTVSQSTWKVNPDESKLHCYALKRSMLVTEFSGLVNSTCISNHVLIKIDLKQAIRQDPRKWSPSSYLLTCLLGTAFTWERLPRHQWQQPHPELPLPKLRDPAPRRSRSSSSPGSTVGGRRRPVH